MSDYSNSARCPQCGSPLPPDARFCENCGASFPANAAPETAAAGPETEAAAYNDGMDPGFRSAPDARYEISNDKGVYGEPENGYGPESGYRGEPGAGYGPEGGYRGGPDGGYGPEGGYRRGPEGSYGPEGGYRGGPDGGYGPEGGYRRGPDLSYRGSSDYNRSSYDGGYGGGYGSGYGSRPDTPALPDSFALRYFGDFCGSPFFLTFVILITSNLVVKFFSNFATIITSIPAIVIVVGLWLLFAGSKTHNMKSNPLGLIRGGLIAELVISIVGNALLIIILVFCLVGSLAVADQLYDSSLNGLEAILPIIFIIPLLIFVVSLIINIFFYRGLIGTTTSVKTMLETGHGSPSIPNVARVLFVIQIIITGFGLLANLFRIGAAGAINTYSYSLSEALNIPQNTINSLLGTSSFSLAFSTISSMLTIAVLVMALMIISRLENTRFEEGY